MKTHRPPNPRDVVRLQRARDEFASELKRGLLLLRYVGHCKCGLMLTERDREPKTGRYRCPHCGATGALAGVASA